MTGRTRGRGEPDGGLRRRMHAALPRVHWQACELGFMGAGAPDSNGCHAGVEFWVEDKHLSAEGMVTLDPAQVGWISRRMRSGGRVFICTWVEHDGGARKGEAVSRLFVHEGWDAAVLKAEGVLAAPPVLVLDGGPGAGGWDWDALLVVFTQWTMSRR